MDKLREAEEAQERIYIIREEAARKNAAKPAAGSKPAKSPREKSLRTLDVDIHPICECCGERIDAGTCGSDASATHCKACKCDAKN